MAVDDENWVEYMGHQRCSESDYPSALEQIPVRPSSSTGSDCLLAGCAACVGDTVRCLWRASLWVSLL